MSALIRYERTLPSFADLLDEWLSDDIFNRWGRELIPNLYPQVDIVEEKDSYRLKADVPGIDKSDLKVEVQNHILTISGEKKEEKKELKERGFYHFERSYGSFSRSFKLPENVDVQKIEAKYSNGVLELVMKKTSEATSKAIEVKVE